MGVIQNIWTFLWPAPLLTSSFPSTFTVYLFGCTLIFSRSLRWRPWAGYEWRWVFLGIFLFLTMVLNGPVLYHSEGIYLKGISYFPLLVELIVLIIAINALTESSLVVVIVSVALGYSCEHAIADIVQAVGTPIYQGNIEFLYSDPQSKALIFCIYVICVVVIWWKVGRTAEISDEVLRDRHGWILACIAVFAFVIFANHLFFMLGIPAVAIQGLNNWYYYLNLLVRVYDMVCSIMVMSMLLLVSSRNHMLREVEIMKDINYRQQRHYEISQEYRDVINMKMHDLKKFFLSNTSVVQKQGAQAEQLIHDTLSQYDALFSTGNQAIDAILNEKSLYCSQRGIALNCLVDGSAVGHMEYVDIYSLVGNIMDNAIEAVEKIDTDTLSKSITLDISKQGSMTVIRQINQFSGEREYTDNLLKTSKPGNYEHGFGMRSIRYVVQQYGGHMSVNTQNQTFSLTILLPLQFA